MNNKVVLFSILTLVANASHATEASLEAESAKLKTEQQHIIKIDADAINPDNGASTSKTIYQAAVVSKKFSHENIVEIATSPQSGVKPVQFEIAFLENADANFFKNKILSDSSLVTHYQIGGRTLESNGDDPAPTQVAGYPSNIWVSSPDGKTTFNLEAILKDKVNALAQLQKNEYSKSPAQVEEIYRAKQKEVEVKIALANYVEQKGITQDLEPIKIRFYSLKDKEIASCALSTDSPEVPIVKNGASDPIVSQILCSLEYYRRQRVAIEKKIADQKPFPEQKKNSTPTHSKAYPSDSRDPPGPGLF